MLHCSLGRSDHWNLLGHSVLGAWSFALRQRHRLSVVACQEPFVGAIHGAGIAGAVGNVIDVLGQEMDGAVGKNKTCSATRVQAAEAFGELVGVVGEMVDGRPTRRQDIVHAIALLALDATGPHGRLMTQLHSLGDSYPADFTDGDRIGCPVLDLTESNIAGRPPFPGAFDRQKIPSDPLIPHPECPQLAL